MFPLSDTSAFARLHRRREAIARLPELEAIAHRVRVRDPDAAHVTIWPGGTGKIQWWPGTGKWTDPGETLGRHAGSLDDLKAFIWKVRGVAAPDESLIEDEDA